VIRPRKDPPPEVTQRQIDASDPSLSAWVSANAGSGKTHVLAQRVIRLLLAGVDPARILCITFTKAAAANMSNRVFGILRAWTALGDDALDAEMRKIGVRRPDARGRERARRLFALALDTPGGLKVQTIHAFCTHVLHLFPFEANVAARFEVLDEAQTRQLLERLSFEVMLNAAAEPGTPLGRALSHAVVASADTTFRDMVSEAIRARDKLTSWIEAAGGVPEAMAELSRALGVEPDQTATDVNTAFFDNSGIPASEWSAVAATLAQGLDTDIEQGKRFAALAMLQDADRIETYLDIFCIKDRSKTRSRVFTNTIKKFNPGLCDRLLKEQARVWSLVERQRAIAARDRSAALFTIAHAVTERFRAEKNRRGLLDYEDLIDKALELLKEPAAAWVHYKLDRGIHHVLIDEAQDTSPKQWAIVTALVSEFFAGRGAHDTTRTIFAVGDEKQSIFSFQGAAPREFAAMRQHFRRLHERAELQFVATEFKHSFRSGPNVLGAVDAVFERAEAYVGLTDDPVAPVHESLPDTAPGLVEIWSLEKADERQPIESWQAPFDIQNASSAPVKLAQRIARNVAAWQRQGRRPGDVLILVRRRGAQFEAIIRALKNAGIPVAGADRLVLTEHIAVMDLVALADVLLLPADDLALATVLKSPLFGLDDDALFALAHGRGEASLRDTIRQRDPELAARIDTMAARARECSPFAFYSELLGTGGHRRAFLERLGHEAADALDEFLNLALDYERAETATLQGFVAWLRAAKSEVKRDMEMERDEVRVMTVHGAKGLEAPVVILADTTSPPRGWHPPRLLSLPSLSGVPGAPNMLVWASSKDNDTGPMAAARTAAQDEAAKEYRRLLYVAMTRAIDRLIVCGVEASRGDIPEGCWYELVRNGLEGVAKSEPADDGSGEVLRFRKTPDEGAMSGETSAQPAHRPEAPPPWLAQPVAAEPARAATIAPSRASAETPADAPAGFTAERRRAIQRGLIVHRLMQSLPDIPDAARRADAARRYIARQTPAPSEADCAAMLDRVTSMLADPRFAALFGPGSRAEVPIVGRVGGRIVSGVVDRLAIAPDTVLIADYKTNRPAPRSPGEAANKYPEYVRQLALYRAVLRQLYPGRLVTAALLWTDTPELMEISADMLDSAFDAVLTPA